MAWFQAFMGCEEEDWDYKVPAHLVDSAGQFETHSLRELRGVLPPNPPHEQHDNRIVLRRRDLIHGDHLYDTSALQVAAMPGTLFQVASNFNCLELGSQYGDAFSGHYLRDLMADTTQGPSAAAGAFAGAVLRLAKHKEKPIDLLEDTPLREMPNGKLQLQPLPEGFDVEAVKIGLHTDVVASFDRSGRCRHVKDGPKIDQVYTSTCICGGHRKKDKGKGQGGGKGKGGEPEEQDYSLAKVLLQAAYEGTYLAAVQRQSPSIVLTLVGGGCFRNPPELIAEAICTAHRKYAPYLPRFCRVVLPLYDMHNHALLRAMDSSCIIFERDRRAEFMESGGRPDHH